MFGSNNWEADEIGIVEISFMHVDGGNLMIVVGSVITDALLEIIAGRVNGDFVLIVTEVTATTLLVDRVKDVEELADTGEFVVW